MGIGCSSVASYVLVLRADLSTMRVACLPKVWMQLAHSSQTPYPWCEALSACRAL